MHRLSQLAVVVFAVAASGCLAIDDFGMFYTTDAAVDATTDATMDATPDGDTDTSVPDSGVPDADGGDACVTNQRYSCGMCGVSCAAEEDCISNTCAEATSMWTVHADSSLGAFVTAVDTDDEGTLIAGSYTMDLNVDGDPAPAAASEELFAAHLAADGTVEWLIATSGNMGTNTVEAVAIDRDSNTGYLVGRLGEYLEVPSGRNVSNPSGSSSVFIWRVELGDGTATELDTISASSTDLRIQNAGVASDGALVFGGFFSGNLTAGATIYPSAGATDIYVNWYRDGASDVRTFGGTGPERLFSLDVAADGAVAFLGNYATPFMFGPTMLPAPVDGTDSIVAFVEEAGPPRWVHTFGGMMNEWSQGIATDETGVYMHMSFGPGGLTAASFDMTGLDGAPSVFVGFDAGSGGVQWSYPTDLGPRLGSGMFPFGHMSAAGGMIYTGVDVDADPRLIDGVTDVFSSGVSGWALIALHADDGRLAWVHTLNASEISGLYGVAGSADGAAYAGTFSGTADFAGTYAASGTFAGLVTYIANP